MRDAKIRSPSDRHIDFEPQKEIIKKNMQKTKKRKFHIKLYVIKTVLCKLCTGEGGKGKGDNATSESRQERKLKKN
jgi:hypothetical protein